MGFKLIRIDSEEPAKIPLQVGTHLIGRGTFLNCDDHRVSRQHGVIKVTDNSVVLKSLHQNPCFYNKPNLHKTLVLPQGKWVSLSNTDHFGLLPDSYWYELIFCNDDNTIQTPTEQENRVKLSERAVGTSSQYKNRNPPTTEEKEATRAISSYISSGTQPYTYKAECDEDIDSEPLNLEFDETMEDCAREAESQSLITGDPVLENQNPTTQIGEPTTTSSNDQTKCDETNCDVQTPGKRLHSPEPHHDAKKIKAEPESPKKAGNPKDLSTDESKELYSQPHSPIDPQSSTDVNKEPQSPTEMNIDPQNPMDVTSDKDVTTEPQTPKDATTDAESAYEEDTDPPSPDKDNEPINDVKKEPQSPDNVKDVKKEPQSPDDVKKDPDGAKPGSSNDQPGSSGDDGSAAKPPAPRPPRERCMYGASCYRKNPQHKLQFSHPQDADYGPGARGRCPYGAGCRRADPRHWAQHDHPPGAAPPHPHPHQGNRAKKRRQVVRPSESEDSDQDSPSPQLIVHGKRKRKPVKRETWSDSGEESQDPYATDESDDWEPPSDVNMSSQSQRY